MIEDMGLLTGDVVIVTGAAGGLGRAVVPEFLTQGAQVWGVLAPSEPDPFSHPRFSPIVADLNSREGAETAVGRVMGAAGKVDVLAHLVGGFAGGQPVEETDEGTWRRMMSLNLYTAVHMVRAVLPHMMSARHGRILAIGTRTAVEPVAGLCAYNASKAALIALIRTIAQEGKSAGITANVLLPSVIDTPANRAANPGADYSKWVPPAAIASLLAFLASRSASDVTGAVIPIYGRM